MLCGCQDIQDDQKGRDKLTRKETPLKMKILNALGLKKYLIDNFIFRKSKPRYRIEQINQNIQIFIKEKRYVPPSGFFHKVAVLQNGIQKIPIACLFLNQKPQLKPILIYSHGNSADLSHSLEFIHKISQVYQINCIAYDYTGYGVSNQNEVTQTSICQDLKKVIQWINRPMEDIILWGFSLGCHPTISAATSFNVNSVILQSPFASILSFFEQQISHQELYKGDCFSNISMIQLIKSNILLIHSRDDDIIPFRHSQALYQRYSSKVKPNKIQFVEVQRLTHNSMHSYFYAKDTINKLQLQMFAFLKKAEKSMKYKKLDQQLGKIKAQQNQYQDEILQQQCLKIEQLIKHKNTFFQKKVKYFQVQDIEPKSIKSHQNIALNQNNSN